MFIPSKYSNVEFNMVYMYINHSYLFKIGGSDQMGNIMSGQELISRLENTRVYGIIYFHS